MGESWLAVENVALKLVAMMSIYLFSPLSLSLQCLSKSRKSQTGLDNILQSVKAVKKEQRNSFELYMDAKGLAKEQARLSRDFRETSVRRASRLCGLMPVSMHVH